MSTDRREIVLVSKAQDIDINAVRTELGKVPATLTHLENTSTAREHLEAHGLPHLLIVDLFPGDLEAFKFCKDLSDLAGLPIITLSSDGSSTAEALDALGCADDYIRRGEMTPVELAWRIRRILSRFTDFAYSGSAEVQLFDWLAVNFVKRQLRVQGKMVQLTPIENAILFVLLTHRGRMVDADVLLERVWRGSPASQDKNALRVHIHRLRHKIEENPDRPHVILTARQTGYSLAA